MENPEGGHHSQEMVAVFIFVPSGTAQSLIFLSGIIVRIVI